MCSDSSPDSAHSDSDHLSNDDLLQERSNHIHFLESLNQVDAIIRGATGLDQMLGDLLDKLLDIFKCDRAWLLYPCDPDAKEWRIPMERTRPEYPGAMSTNTIVPMSEPAGEY